MWRACERWKILPPGVVDNWDKNNSWAQANLIGYDQIRQSEDDEKQAQFLKALYGSTSKNIVR